MSTKNSSPIIPLVLAAIAAVGVAVGINQYGNEAHSNKASDAPAPIRPRWTATASGRVEPNGGEIRLTPLTNGRIVAILAGANDKVTSGDLVVQLDDSDAVARVMSADAEAGVRKRERDSETNVPRLAQDRRTAEDKLNTTERAIATARLELDRLLKRRHGDAASVTAQQLGDARQKLSDATARLPVDREAYRTAQLVSGVPLPTRLEAGLTAARSELSLAEDALERTRIRAPMTGTILQLHARVGEVAAAASETPLMVLGDLSSLRVRAEVEERDAVKVHVGQVVVLKTDAFGDREFSGRVATIAQSLRPPTLAQRGPRRPTDVDALEVLVNADAGSPLMPGMRVDVFFKVEPVTSEPPRADAGKPAAMTSVTESKTAEPAKTPEPAKPEPAKMTAPGAAEPAKPEAPASETAKPQEARQAPAPATSPGASGQATPQVKTN